MKSGLYEKMIDNVFKKDIENHSVEKRSIEETEEVQVISLAYQKALREKLRQMTKEERIAFIKKINEELNLPAFLLEGDIPDQSMVQLLAVHDNRESLKALTNNRPKSSLANSTLFTGQGSLTLESELRREIRTADRMDFLISFIKFSGLVLLIDDLKAFTAAGKKLRVITTSYMGASDYKAIETLAKLPNVEVKISFDTKRTRLHAKAYYFERETGFSTAYIGSSNMSNPALSKGLEWNLKVSEYTSQDVMAKFRRTFDTYWNDHEFVTFDPNSEEHCKELRTSLSYDKSNGLDAVFFDLRPYPYQTEILEELQKEREVFGSYRNLVVAATGTGKTMVAAFDYKAFRKNHDGDKLLFLAHREEILKQSLMTFRGVLKDQNFGELWNGNERPTEYNHVFASVQTLSRGNRYKQLKSDEFDYIVIDESHHSTADSYMGMLDYFSPKILLGLTATPERMDGGNILEHFNNRMASEIRLTEAINRKLLSPFHYFAVTDPVSLENMKWQRSGYKIDQLENIYTSNTERVSVILDSLEKYLTDVRIFKGLGFCVSIAHAEFMASKFNKAGIKSISLTSNSSDGERKKAKELLQTGEINCIFTVDLFNEGVDIPEVDTVLFLRPTESLTVFLQQLGRGLRLTEDKEALTVLDYVGQAHKDYDFSMKFRALMGKTKKSLKKEIEEEFPSMPKGCHIRLEKIAQQHILNNIQSSMLTRQNIIYKINMYEQYFEAPFTLANFIDKYDLDIKELYKKHSFYQLQNVAEHREEWLVENQIELKHACWRFAQANSRRFLLFSKSILEEGYRERSANGLLLAMFHYTIWGRVPEISFLDSLSRLKENNSDMVEELLEIIDYKLAHQTIIEKSYEDSAIPLDIYAQYSIDQLMAAFGKTNEQTRFPLRAGVYYVREKNADLFFITINKVAGDYLPTTMYNDYASDNHLFHWESQGVTSIASPTGQRYINDRADKHKVLFFVRSNKKEHGSKTATYTFLGNARYVSHEGERPIEMVWRLDHAIPEKIIRESELKVAE
jgi:superfamily II DNA or RNA helicase